MHGLNKGTTDEEERVQAKSAKNDAVSGCGSYTRFQIDEFKVKFVLIF